MTAVLLFAKAPRAGFVKRRLAREIGDQAAASAYRTVGARVVAQVGKAWPITVWYDPPDALDEMRQWLGTLEFRAQVGGDLGERLRHAFDAHFAQGHSPVVAIGADAPGVDAATIQAAVAGLSEADVVLGPALDGGYYLLGLSQRVPDLFAGIAWGGADVLHVTLEICQRCHLGVRQLGPLRDLDTAADLRALGLQRP